MNKIVSKEVVVEDLIYEIRGKQVMIDSDLALLYQVETKRINEAVKNNTAKFPERFSWVLSNEEEKILRSKKTTSSLTCNYGGRRYNTRVFTEQGVAMLSTILKSKTATEISIRIMDAFAAMRHYISDNLIEQKHINDIVLEDHKKIQLLEESFKKLEKNKKINEIYFNGQIYDAYSKIQDIFKSATKSLIIVDAYADNTLLDIVKRLKIKVIIITKNNSLLTKQDISKYNMQYHNLKVIFNNEFHDRYFIIDSELVYHCGTSINRIGYRTFSINIINDKYINKLLMSRVNNIITMNK